MIKKKIVSKNFWWKLLLIVIGYLGVMLGVFFYALNRVKTDTKTASADTITTTPYCKTIGTTTVDGSSSTGSPDCFAVYMHGLNNSGSQTVQRGYISNWSSYIFMVDAMDIKEHLTLALYKGNVLYKSVSVSGNENLSVNFGALASGYYTLKYECRYKKNLLSSNVYYTYEYFFEVDITNPSYSISEGTGTGNYTNRTIYYYADDLNFSHIRYRAPWDSAYSSYYGKSYTVEATQGNSGQWDFYAIDTVGNRSPIVTRWIDVKSPSGTVTSQSGTTISNGGATKEPFKYTASDNMSISRMEYKKAGSSTWETYTANKMISGIDGWYTFRAIDEAGNVSDEYRVMYDVGKPTGTLYDASGAKSSGTITNKTYVKYVASDAASGVATVYVQKPGTSSFVKYTNGDALTAEGKYRFKAVDASGNETSTIQEITLDLTAPTGQLKANGTNVVSGSYTSQSFSYTASDAVGVAILQMKRPNSTSWETYTAGTAITGAEGWYSFRATDLAGNVSGDSNIFYDVSKPTMTLIGANIGGSGTVLTSGGVAGSECIRATAIDTGSGIASIRVWGDNYSSAVSYVAGTELTKEGRYYFDATNKAGITSDTYRIVLDKTAPNGVLYANGIKVNSGTVTNAYKIMYMTNDSLAGVESCFVKKPNTSTFIEYTSATELTEAGKYEFYSVDYAGNQSAVSTITIDRSIPTAQLYVDGKAVENGSYTNGQYVKFESNGTCYVKKPNTTEFVAYIAGTEFYEAGRYEFFAKNEALTATEKNVIIIDREPKMVSITRPGKLGAWRDYEFTWVDGNKNTTAPIVRITVNGYDYEFGSTIYTLEGQQYNVVVYDAAGNEWTTTLKAGVFDIPTYTVQKVFWEVEMISLGETFSFEKYENALLSATSIENALIQMKVWNTETWDQGIPMDTKDSANAKNGTYYLYKSEEAAEKQVAYFTQERLNEVVKKYAEERIVAYYYWQKDPAEGVDLTVHAYRDQFKIVATKVHLREGVIYTLDGTPYSSLEITEPGGHTLLLEDGYGGAIEYEIYILDKAQSMEYALGENSQSKAEYGRTYHFNGKVTLSIPFEGDDLAMFAVYDKVGELLGYYDIENPCLIDKSGSYTAVAYNHYGESEVFSFVVSMDAPTISTVNNEAKKQLEIVVMESVDKVSHISFLEISKSDDGGETWIALTEDDYGKAITIETLQYKFRTDGMYKVVVMDEFRTGVDALVYTVEYTQPAPIGKLEGVENGGVTNTAVAFTWKDEVIVTLLKDGVAMEYRSGQKLTEDGVYVLTFEDFNGYKETYTFTIDTIAPEIKTEGAEHREAVNEDVKVFYTEENLTAELYKDGKSLGSYTSGNPISADGQYRVRVYDLAGNEVSVEFTIDKTVEYDINVYDKGLSNSVVVISQEVLTTELIKDGEKKDYALGSAITEIGDYTLVLTDMLGNNDVISFRIIQPILQEFTHNFDDIEGFGGVLVNGEDKRLNYGTLELFKDGKYEVGVIVGGKTYNFAVTVDKTAPALTVNGVENGGGTKESVTLSDLSEKATMKVYLNDTEITYELGQELTDLGKYRVVLTDEAGNTSTYEFEILFKMNGGAIALIVIGVAVVLGVGLAIILGKRATYKKQTKVNMDEDGEEEIEDENTEELDMETSEGEEGETP